eukprot:scaffold3104_cov124-Skeletonema_marinoi.AAC.5
MRSPPPTDRACLMVFRTRFLAMIAKRGLKVASPAKCRTFFSSSQQQPDFDRHDRESDTSTPPYSEVLFCTPQYSGVIPEYFSVLRKNSELLRITPILRSSPE